MMCPSTCRALAVLAIGVGARGVEVAEDGVADPVGPGVFLDHPLGGELGRSVRGLRDLRRGLADRHLDAEGVGRRRAAEDDLGDARRPSSSPGRSWSRPRWPASSSLGRRSRAGPTPARRSASPPRPVWSRRVLVSRAVSQMSPTTSRPPGTAAAFPSYMLSKAIGSWPCLRSQRRQALPMYPAPPVRRIFIDGTLGRGSVAGTQDHVGGGRQVGDRLVYALGR